MTRRSNITAVPATLLPIPVIRRRRSNVAAGNVVPATLIAVPALRPNPRGPIVAGTFAPATVDLALNLVGQADRVQVKLFLPLDPPANANARPIRKPFRQHVECPNRRGYKLQEQLDDWDPETYQGLQRFIKDRITHYTNMRMLFRRRTISYQPAAAINAVLREARAEYPILEGYLNNWPARDMIIMCLSGAAHQRK